MLKTKFKKASALVVTMMILGIMLVTALSVSLVSLKERKTAMSGSKSGQAFQNAQSGVELVMQAVVKGGLDTVNQIAGAISNDAICDGDDGLIKNVNIPYAVELRNADDEKIACDSDTDISTVASLKSIGSGGDSQRAIQAAVAAGGGGCYVDYSLAAGKSAGDNCKVTGFTIKGSAGKWGSCVMPSGLGSHFRPPSGDCLPGWGYAANEIGEAYVCCQ